MRSLKFLPHLVMNKNITSGYSGVKLLRETYTLESPRDPCRNRRPGRYSWRVNTPFTRDIIRGRVHIRAHWSRSCRRGELTILYRRLSFHVAAAGVFVESPHAFSDFRSGQQCNFTSYVPDQKVARIYSKRQEVCTCCECMNQTANVCIVRYTALRPLKTRYGFALSRR